MIPLQASCTFDRLEWNIRHSANTIKNKKPGRFSILATGLEYKWPLILLDFNAGYVVAVQMSMPLHLANANSPQSLLPLYHRKMGEILMKDVP